VQDPPEQHDRLALGHSSLRSQPPDFTTAANVDIFRAAPPAPHLAHFISFSLLRTSSSNSCPHFPHRYS
jgi:hypothetical protein